jgi:uncharacterized protein (TIGR02677 family)
VRERRFGTQPLGVVPGGDEQRRCGVLSDTVQADQRGRVSGDERAQTCLELGLLRLDRGDAAGEAAIAGVEHALDHLASTGALQTAVLDAIADRLAELARLAADPAADDRRLYVAVTELEGHLESLRASTKRFNSELQRLLRDDAADGATFSEVKGATIAYLEEYVTDLDVRAGAIAQGIDRVADLGIAAVHARALAGADLPTFLPTASSTGAR